MNPKRNYYGAYGYSENYTCNLPTETATKQARSSVRGGFGALERDIDPLRW